MCFCLLISLDESEDDESKNKHEGDAMKLRKEGNVI